jgi:hypothetical protein
LADNREATEKATKATETAEEESERHRSLTNENENAFSEARRCDARYLFVRQLLASCSHAFISGLVVPRQMAKKQSSRDNSNNNGKE